jgi:integrase
MQRLWTMAKAKNGASVRTRLSWPWMGFYVEPQKLRMNGEDAGTWRIFFRVPARLRPSGWPPTIALPRDRPYCKGPDDLEAILRIREDAKALYEALRNGRGVEPVAAPEALKGSIPWLMQQWGGSRLLSAVRGEIETMEVSIAPGEEGEEGGRDDWAGMKPSTRAGAIRALRHVFAWSLTNKHKHIRGIGPQKVKAFLDLYKATPGQRKNIRFVLSKLFSIAIEEQEIDRSPMAPLRATRTRKAKRAVVQWDQSSVSSYAQTARSSKAWCMGRGGAACAWPGGALLIQIMWETAADSTDAIRWTKAENFRDNHKRPGIEFDRGKTGVPAFIPISRKLAAEIRANGSLFLITDPQGKPYLGFKDDSRLRRHMQTLRKYAVQGGAPHLIFDHLRHSAATHAEACGAPADDIRHLTAHSSSKMNRSIYLQNSAAKAEEIQRLRGIID